MKKPTKILIYALLALLITGCSWLGPYKRDIQQGNLLDDEALDQLKVGMRPDQVKYLLGTPLLTPLGQPNQWDYVYQVRSGQQLKARKRVSLVFEPDENNRLQVASINIKENQVNVESLDQLIPSADEGVPATNNMPAQPRQPDPQQREPGQVPGGPRGGL
jgi:outer membrane protein assembly factor BamE